MKLKYFIVVYCMSSSYFDGLASFEILDKLSFTKITIPVPRVFFIFVFFTIFIDGRSTPLPHLELDPINNADLKAALATTKPSARQLQEKYFEWQKEYESV